MGTAIGNGCNGCNVVTVVTVVTMMGVAIGNVALNACRRHPFARRPLIDFHAVGLLESATLGGALMGTHINKLLPAWVVLLLTVVVLAVSLQVCARGVCTACVHVVCARGVCCCSLVVVGCSASCGGRAACGQRRCVLWQLLLRVCVCVCVCV